MNQERPYPYNSEFKTRPEEDLVVLNGFEVVHDVTLEAKGWKNRFVVQNMANYTGHPQNLLFHALKDSANRGVFTSLTIDWFSKKVAHDGLPWYANSLPIGDGKLLRDLTEQSDEDLYEELTASDVNIEFTNPPKGRYEKLNPFSGRSHIKFIVGDDTSYIGGVNMDDSSFKGVDFMVKIKDKQLADILANRDWKAEEGKDYSAVLDNGDTLLVDAGEKGRSIILDTAVTLVEESSEYVKNASFFTPDGEFLRAVHGATERGVNVTVAIPKEQHGLKLVADTINKLVMNIKRQRIDIERFKGQSHSKLLIVDGKVAIFGSHNLMQSGVRMGTAEIAYLTQNPVIIENLQRFFDKLVSRAV